MITTWDISGDRNVISSVLSSGNRDLIQTNIIDALAHEFVHIFQRTNTPNMDHNERELKAYTFNIWPNSSLQDMRGGGLNYSGIYFRNVLSVGVLKGRVAHALNYYNNLTSAQRTPENNAIQKRLLNLAVTLWKK